VRQRNRKIERQRDGNFKEADRQTNEWIDVRKIRLTHKEIETGRQTDRQTEL
jgi:hypothetical protein